MYKIKPKRCMKNLTKFLSLLMFFAVSTPILINAQTQEQTKKKTGFGNFFTSLGDVAKELVSVNNQPVNGNSSNSLVSSYIQGEWKGLGSGGEYNIYEYYNYVPSPRNHHFTFDVTQENTNSTFTFESSVNAVARIYSPNWQQVASITNGFRQQTQLARAGTYYVIISANRYSRGKYELKIDGSVKNIIQKQFNEWKQSDISFGDEGGGGAYSNTYSPRNHIYTFEPELDSYFDINIESNGIPIGMSIINPNGSVDNGFEGGSQGIRNRVIKAKSKGKYYIAVYTIEANVRGKYEIDVVGTFKESPTRIEKTFKLIQAQFASNSRKHEYIIPAQPGNIEVIYRSTTTEADFNFIDAYNQALRPHFDNRPTGRLIDRSVEIKDAGNITLTVNTEQSKPENYELLIWGNFGDITSKQLKTSDNKTQMQPKPNLNETPNTATNQVTLSGQIKSQKANASYSTMRIIYEDLETGQRVGEVTPDAGGIYTISVVRGKRYGITALTEDGTIASSQNINLIRTSPNSLRVPLIEVVDAEIGAVINLNNIFFETGKYQLLPASFAELERVAGFLKANPNLKVEIAGHTDNVGNSSSNQSLSQERASAVTNYLMGQRIEATRLVSKGYGSTKSVAPNTTEAGKQQNRRVEFRIVGK